MTQKHKISVIVAIHQPNVEILDIFDNLYILSKGGVNVYSGLPQNLRQHLIDVHIDCNVNEIAIEKCLKVCANDSNNFSIIDMQEATNRSQNCIMEQISREMVIKGNRKSNWSVEFSLLSFWYLIQRMLLIYYHTFILQLIMIILLFVLNGLIMLTFCNFTPSKYRDCRLDNSTQQCNELFDDLTNLKYVQYEIKLLIGTGLSPFILIALWTSITMYSHIKIFIWEYHNGLYYFLLQLNLYSCKVVGSKIQLTVIFN